MEINTPAEKTTADPGTAKEYQKRYGRSMMVLRKLRESTPGQDELCRITSVNSLPPDLWVTVQFLDGSARSFRPDMIQPADSAQ